MTVGFVLSGGASLGAIQVGMLQALAEHEVRPDLVIGTSAGALNAAWVAGHPGLAGLDQLAEIWAGLRARDVFPLRPWPGVRALMGRGSALISSEPLRRLIERHLTFDRLEEAAIPLYVVATDVITGAEVLLDHGDAVAAITASASLPGIFAPVELDGNLLMDGGIANNTPISHAVALGADTVYVLPTGHGGALDEPPHHPLAMVLHAVGQLLQQRLAQDIERYRGLIDLRVVPPLSPLRVSPTDFSHGRELIARAHAATTVWLDAGSRLLADVQGTDRTSRCEWPTSPSRVGSRCATAAPTPARN
jgi:NTE family protein